MGSRCSELELGGSVAGNPTLEAPVVPPPQPHLPLQVQTALPQLIPLISLLTQKVVPAGLMRGVGGKEGQGTQESRGGDWRKEAGISRGREEESKKPSGSKKRRLGPQGTGGR